MLAFIVTAGLALAAASDLVAGEVTLVSEGYLFSEGPLWIPGEGLILSDVMKDTVYRADHSEFRKPSNRTNGMALDPEGRIISCESKLARITRTEKDGSVTVLADAYEGKALGTTNDVVVSRSGLIYFTDPIPLRKKDDSVEKSGAYRLDPESGALTRLSDTAKYPNGIGLSPDESVLYVADYTGHVIRAYDVAADGQESNERTLCKVENPDGFAVDSQGNLWIASKADISVFDANGAMLDEFATPTPSTNCCFGGPDGKTLYITGRTKLFQIPTHVTGQGSF